MAEATDYSWARPGGRALQAAGKCAAGRYAYPGGGKGLTAGELADLQHYGQAVWIIYEGSGQDATNSVNGAADARQAQQQVASLGYPNAVIYFAIDEAVAPNLTAYFQGVQSVLPKNRVGVYGGLDTILACQRGGLATWFYQTYAWSRGIVAPGIHIYQYLNGQTINGGSVDFDRTLQSNFGQLFGTAGPSGQVVSGSNECGQATKVVQAALNKFGYNLVEDDIYGPNTTAAVEDYQKKHGLAVDGIVGPKTWASLTATIPQPSASGVVPGGTLKIGESDPAPAFPLPAGSYFGPKSGPTASVSGYFSHAADLRTWQDRMQARGWSLTADGLYGPQTQAVARAFQSQKGLATDGLIGPQTWAAAWTSPVTV